MSDEACHFETLFLHTLVGNGTQALYSWIAIEHCISLPLLSEILHIVYNGKHYHVVTLQLVSVLL